MILKKYIIFAVLGIGCLPAVSCKKFLDVKPEDRLLEEQVFSTETGIQNALNGIYLGLTEEGLYGGALTLSTVDVMAQRYNLGSASHSMSEIGKYNYNGAYSRNTFNNIWTTGYKTILNINQFIRKLEKTAGVVSNSNRQLLLGEAYGMRALIHFDLFRLFGPLYSVSPEKNTIPYYHQPVAAANPLLPASAVAANVLKDLDSAMSMLKDDPIISRGLQQSDTLEGSNFYRYRSIHFNYYAVKTLKARVQLYLGQKEAALATAEEVIRTAGVWFPWTPLSSVNSNESPNRVFSTEVIFGIQNTDLHAQHAKYFGSQLNAANILAPLDRRLNDVFESNQNDYRFNSCWKIPNTGGKDYRTFFKFEDFGATRYPQPLIRLSELYYIAAETHPDPATAFEYLNTVRLKRGLASLPVTANLGTAIGLEYQREFWGEGQLFFYYKRKATATIPNGSASSGTLTMTDLQYVVPLPFSETQFRN